MTRRERPRRLGLLPAVREREGCRLMFTAIAWEATYQVLRQHLTISDTPDRRAIWVYGPFARPDDSPLLEVRLRQARRWLRIEARERARQATMAHRHRARRKRG